MAAGGLDMRKGWKEFTAKACDLLNDQVRSILHATLAQSGLTRFICLLTASTIGSCLGACSGGPC